MNAEDIIVARLQRLIRDYDFLSAFKAPQDWAAIICLHYWERYEGLQWRKTNISRRLTSPETILRLARKYGLTPYKAYSEPQPEPETTGLDTFIEAQDSE